METIYEQAGESSQPHTLKLKKSRGVTFPINRMNSDHINLGPM